MYSGKKQRNLLQASKAFSHEKEKTCEKKCPLPRLKAPNLIVSETVLIRKLCRSRQMAHRSHNQNQNISMHRTTFFVQRKLFKLRDTETREKSLSFLENTAQERETPSHSPKVRVRVNCWRRRPLWVRGSRRVTFQTSPIVKRSLIS